MFFGLWVGREHLGDVVRKAFKGDDSVDDSGEMLSYRAAVFIWLGGVAVMTLWLWQAGLPLWAAFLTVLMALLIVVGLTRVRVEGGVAAAVGPMISSSVLVSAVGSTVIGPAGLVGMAYTYVWAADIRTFVMASWCPRAQARRRVRAAFASAFLVYAIGDLYQFARFRRHDYALGLTIWGHKSQWLVLWWWNSRPF